MKKAILTLSILLATGTTQAVELGVVGGGVSGSNAGGLAGVTVGQKFDKFGVTAGYSQAWLKSGDQNRWSVVGSYDVYSAGSFTVAGKLGYVYLNQDVNSASAGLIGLGVEVPVSKKFALTADYAYQFAQNSQNMGNVLSAGVKYKF